MRGSARPDGIQPSTHPSDFTPRNAAPSSPFTMEIEVKKLLAIMILIQAATINDAAAFDAEVARRTAERASGWKVCKSYSGPKIVCFVTNAPDESSYQGMSAVYNAVTLSADASNKMAFVNVSDRNLGRDFTKNGLEVFLKGLGIATAAARVVDFDASVAAMKKAQPVSGFAVPGTRFGRTAKVQKFEKTYSDGRMTYACGYSGRLEIRSGQNCAIVIEGAN